MLGSVPHRSTPLAFPDSLFSSTGSLVHLPHGNNREGGGVCYRCTERQGVPVTMAGGDERTFDSFECAIHALAPVCEYCGVRVIGHGVEAEGHFYCCAHCASMAGAEGVADRA